ncbi:DUF7560 family zinc ribbon protein [Halovenus rubra]
MSRSTDSTFVCPDCNGPIDVTTSTREAILKSGCPRCATPVSPDDFA